MLSYILILLGFIVLITGADLLVKGASSLARRMKISDMTIGLTVVAFGTSAPELSVNVLAAVRGTADIAIGNVLGSNIANVFLILGVASLIMPLKVTSEVVWRETPMNLLATVALFILANDILIDGEYASFLSRSDGMILLSFFAVFLYYTISESLRSRGAEEITGHPGMGIFKSLLWVVLGLAGLVLGGQWIVSGAVAISKAWGVSQSVIGLTVVAVGTSLPELATSAVAAYRGNADIAVGNVVGSNIFNLLFILGISALVHPLPMNVDSNRDIGVVLLAGLLLFLAMFTGARHKIDRWEGAVFLSFYIGYLVWILAASTG